MNQVLIIDDDRKLRDLLQQFLRNQGIEADTVESADMALERIMTMKYDLITVDLMMPGMNGIDFTKKFKEKHNDIPVLMLTAKGDAHERVAGLESGADDYLSKPFEPQELFLRITKLIDRFKNSTAVLEHKENDTVRFGDFEFHLESRALTKSGARVILSSSESDLLYIFCTNINQPVERAALAYKFNGISERSVDVQVTRLRKKIEDDPKNPVFLQTSRGKGYVFRV